MSLASQSAIGLPHTGGGSSLALPVSRPARRSLAFRPAWSLSCSSNPSTWVLQTMSLPPRSAQAATNRSDNCCAGFAPARKTRLSTAHARPRLSGFIRGYPESRPRNARDFPACHCGHRHGVQSSGDRVCEPRKRPINPTICPSINRQTGPERQGRIRPVWAAFGESLCFRFWRCFFGHSGRAWRPSIRPDRRARWARLALSRRVSRIWRQARAPLGEIRATGAIFWHQVPTPVRNSPGSSGLVRFPAPETPETTHCFTAVTATES